MTSQVENLRQTYDGTYDELMTNRKIFFVIWPVDRYDDVLLRSTSALNSKDKCSDYSSSGSEVQLPARL